MMTKDDRSKEIQVCSLCGSRKGPFTNIKQGGANSRIFGCACPLCQELPEAEWNRRVRILMSEDATERYKTSKGIPMHL